MLPSQYTSAGSHRIKALCGPQVDDSWVGNLCKSPVQFEKAPGKAVEAKCNLQWLQTDIFHASKLSSSKHMYAYIHIYRVSQNFISEHGSRANLTEESIASS